MEEIAKGLKELAKAEPAIMLGVVKGVNTYNNTIQAEVDGLEYTNVRLNATAISSSQKALFIPEIGTTVVLARIEHSEEDFKVLGVDKIERVLIQVQNTVLEVDKDGIKISRDGYDFKSILDGLMDSIINMVVTVPNGVGNLSPSSVTQIEQYKSALGKIFK